MILGILLTFLFESATSRFIFLKISNKLEFSGPDSDRDRHFS